MWEALQFDFMRHALAAGALISISCGIIGVLVVVNRIAMISGGIAHAAYGGIGLAVFLGIAPFIGATAFAVFIGLAMGWVSLRRKHRSDAVIGALWAIGMAVGVLFIDLSPGYNVDLMSYLFGSILAVGKGELWFMLLIDVFVVATAILFYKELLAMSYDEEFSVVIGVPVRVLYFLLLTLTSFTVVMLIRVVGLILVIALLTIPPYISEQYTDSLGKMMALSILLSIFFITLGLWLSYTFNLSSGASIIVVSGAAFFLSQALHITTKEAH
ncbi:MAG: metal ABC transporter permease [Deltaproteobacteria bacterium]|nr:metal ABC transporter permease [Deltaproteobacteria bacterium]MBW1928402.1 metal ABC transporter permease [Deltaproteobacteria bacterium]MBW2023799.1 metal ABC transporter permease [Deltaproteobacteria bacterium]MBW2124329.1 metal ABC transporter permease [Deltaproteobacteria bacterium]